MIQHLLRLFLILSIAFCFSCDDDNGEQPVVVVDVLNWSLDGTDFALTQESIEAKMTYTSDANVNHLGIVGTSETGEVLTIYVQELFPGGVGSCLSIERYEAEVIEENCFDNGFLVICDHGGCEYENSEGKKMKSLDVAGGGHVTITSCDDEAKTISGNFNLIMVETGIDDPEELPISGSFENLVYSTN